MSELLFYGGIAISIIAAISAIIATILLRISKVRLKKRLDAEYGKPW